MAKSTFKEEHDLGLNRTFLLVFGVLILNFDHVFSFELSEKRSAEAARIREKYSDRIPVRPQCFSYIYPKSSLI